MKVFDLAKKLNLKSTDLMKTIKLLKLPVRSHMVELTPEQVEQINQFLDPKASSKKTSTKKTSSKKTTSKKATKKTSLTIASTKTTKKASTKTTSSKKLSTKKATSKTTTKKTSTKKATSKTTTKKPSTKKVTSKTTTKKSSTKKATSKTTTKKPSTKKVTSKITTKKTSTKKATKTRIVKPSTPEVEMDPKPKKPTSRIIIRRKTDEKSIKTEDSDATSSSSEKSEEKLVSSVGSSSKSMRLDLVSVRSTNPLEEEFWNKEDEEKKQEELAEDKKQPKRPIAEKEISSKFNATDFRKREVIFQPRKKKIAQLGETKSTQITTPKSHKRVIKVHGDMSFEKLCKKLGLKRKVLIKKLKSEGLDTSDLTVLDYETIALITPDFGWTAKNTKQTEKEILEKLENKEVQDKKREAKPPVVTIMGHVDHGKTTLLDTIRKTKVAEGEAGGITQHIGAYSVSLDGKPITFIDTPGHAAFTAMRSRGAKVTDVVVILVAADDGVQPQTLEALNHAKLAETPYIIAISKIDVPGANIDRVKQQMSEHGAVSEDWGGDISFVPISGLKGEGIKELLEQIQLLAEIQELKYNPEALAKGVTLEARKEKGLGCIVSLLVQEGVLSVGSTLVVGEQISRVRQMKNDQGQVVKTMPAGFPVEMVGLNDLPQAGDTFCVVKNEKSARDLIALRKSENQVEVLDVELSPEELLEKLKAQTEAKKEILHLVLKADTRGSLEALKKSLEEIKSDEVDLKIIHSAAGAITESDVLLASTVSGSVFGFNVRPDGKATLASKEKSVSIYSYSVIYQLLDEVKKRLLGLLKADFVEENQGEAEVRDIFHISKIGTIAGCYVKKGKILRSSFARLIRDGRLIYEGPLSSLRRHKDDVKQVGEGLECGISFETFNDIKPKDIIECYIKKEQARTEL